MTTVLHVSTKGIAGVLGALVMVVITSDRALANCGSGTVPLKPEEAIALATKPSPLTTGDNEFTVTILDANCTPVVGAAVTIELVMPAMPGMPEMRNTVTLAAPRDPKAAGAGIYTGRGQVFMAGKWTATITATVKGARVAARTLTLTAR